MATCSVVTWSFSPYFCGSKIPSYNPNPPVISDFDQVLIPISDFPVAIPICNLLHGTNTDSGGNPGKGLVHKGYP